LLERRLAQHRELADRSKPGRGRADDRRRRTRSGMGSSPVLSRCTIVENVTTGPSASSYGGGVFFLLCTPTLRECSIRRNRAGRGGGVLCWGNAKPRSRTARSRPTCPSMARAAASAASVKLRRDSPGAASWGITRAAESGEVRVPGLLRREFPRLDPPLHGRADKLHHRGQSVADGDAAGGLQCYRAEPLLYYCTITANSSPTHGAVFCWEATPVLTNCIVWGNVPNTLCGQTPYCMTFEDPRFVDPASLTSRLSRRSRSRDRSTCFPRSWFRRRTTTSSPAPLHRRRNPARSAGRGHRRQSASVVPCSGHGSL